jgi:NAD(P)-dependent dehydrogenase (short-subunit alcohol dehydrogenase family)
MKETKVEPTASGDESGVVVVTGGSRGIGAATALAAAERGFSVAVNYARGEEEAAAVVRMIRERGVPAAAIQADIGKEEDIVRMFVEAERELGPVRGLVNNAAVTGGFARVEDVVGAALERMLSVNVAGVILCAREAVRRMSTKRGGNGGAIVNISSIAARTGSAGEWAHYAASKAAVNSFTIGLAREVATDGIRVNAVAPGLIATGLHAANGEPGRLERLKSSIPMGRAGTAEEVAEAVVWLLSEKASYVTGSILEVGGGR